MSRILTSLLVLVTLLAAGAATAQPVTNRSSPDAPELSSPGSFSVGLRSISLVPRAQAKPAPSNVIGRRLSAMIWYPAKARSNGKAVVYRYALPGEPPRGFVSFSSKGFAVRGATAIAGRFPLVIVSHGYSNEPEALSWLAENLASKGYVVVAIAHHDPDISNRALASEVMVQRPLDIAFAAQALSQKILAHAPGLASADPARTVLIGYSMGGYGVLTAAGAILDPSGGPVALPPGRPLAAFARGQARAGELAVPRVIAVVAISPAGIRLGAWGAQGLAAITAPLLLIGGSRDTTVGFSDGIAPVFDQAIHAQRYFLVYQNAGHALGLEQAPDGARSQLWDFQWFEDPVWRKDRIQGISLHMITAFLDRYAKGDETRAAYLDSDVVLGADGAWPASVTGYGALSPGGPGIAWKGFHRNTAYGLELHRRPSAP